MGKIIKFILTSISITLFIISWFFIDCTKRKNKKKKLKKLVGIAGESIKKISKTIKS